MGPPLMGRPKSLPKVYLLKGLWINPDYQNPDISPRLRTFLASSVSMTQYVAKTSHLQGSIYTYTLYRHVCICMLSIMYITLLKQPRHVGDGGLSRHPVYGGRDEAQGLPRSPGAFPAAGDHELGDAELLLQAILYADTVCTYRCR